MNRKHETRFEIGRQVVSRLLSSVRVPMGSATPASFPDEPGLYLFADRSSDEPLRAGESQSLRSRIYRNHLMGSQPGNLPAQLIAGGEAENQNAAKVWIRARCDVRFLTYGQVESIELDRFSAEHFVLGAIRPRFTEGR